MHFTRVRDRKKVKEVKRISALWFSFTQDTSTLYSSIQNLKTLALLRAEKSGSALFVQAYLSQSDEGMNTL